MSRLWRKCDVVACLNANVIATAALMVTAALRPTFLSNFDDRTDSIKVAIIFETDERS